MDCLHHIRSLMREVSKIRRDRGVWNFEFEQMPKRGSQRFLRFQNERAELASAMPGNTVWPRARDFLLPLSLTRVAPFLSWSRRAPWPTAPRSRRGQIIFSNTVGLSLNRDRHPVKPKPGKTRYLAEASHCICPKRELPRALHASIPLTVHIRPAPRTTRLGQENLLVRVHYALLIQ